MERQATRFWIGGGLLLVYLFSLYLPVARATTGDFMYGYMVLMMGWAGVFMVQYAWFANLLFYALLPAITLFSRPVPWISRTVAVLLALCTVDAMLWRNIPNDANVGLIVEYGVGYFLWLGCMTATVGWTFVRTRRSFSSDPSNLPEKI